MRIFNILYKLLDAGGSLTNRADCVAAIPLYLAAAKAIHNFKRKLSDDSATDVCPQAELAR